MFVSPDGSVRSRVRNTLNRYPRVYDAAKFGAMCASYVLRRPHDPEYRLFEHLQPDDLDAYFIDVGANAGQSVLSFRIFNKKTPIVSFEANPALAGSLRRVARLVHGMEYRMVALGEADGECQLLIPRRGNFVISQAASTDPTIIERRRSTISRRAGGSFETEKVSVPLRRFDGLGLRPFAIKIDVEGAELQVLNGMVESIEAHEPLLMLEVLFGDWAPLQLLQELGYRPFEYQSDTHTLVPVDGEGDESLLNVVCLRPRHWAALASLIA